MPRNRFKVDSNNPLFLRTTDDRGVHDSIPNVHAMASAGKDLLTYYYRNYSYDDVSAVAGKVNLQLNAIPATVINLQQNTVDEVNSNYYSR